MLIRIVIFTLLSWMSAGVVLAGSSEATNEQPGLNANPQIEMYPGQQKDIEALMESVRVANIQRLLEMLTSLRNNETDKVIKMLEADLVNESKLLRRRSSISKEAEETMKRVTEYNELFGVESVHNKAPQPTQ